MFISMQIKHIHLQRKYDFFYNSRQTRITQPLEIFLTSLIINVDWQILTNARPILTTVTHWRIVPILLVLLLVPVTKDTLVMANHVAVSCMSYRV